MVPRDSAASRMARGVADLSQSERGEPNRPLFPTESAPSTSYKLYSSGPSIVLYSAGCPI